jgi:hypothetical protein
VTTGARPCALPSPATAAQPGTDRPVSSQFTSRHGSGSASATGSGSAAPPRSTSVPAVTAASSRASRLARQHGTTTLVLAETTARQDALGGPAAQQRAAALALASPGMDPGHPDIAEAAA